jgi:hypothetical protein
LINPTVGQPVLFDAAAVDSYTRRLRNYWTNLADTGAKQLVLNGVQRTPCLQVNDILAHASAQVAGPKPAQPPYYPVSTPGEQLSVLPTLVARKGPYAFSRGGPGLVKDDVTGELREPTAAERERAMGYDADVTAAPGVSERHHCEILGRAMDANALQALLLCQHRCRAFTVIWLASSHVELCCSCGKVGALA